MQTMKPDPALTALSLDALAADPGLAATVSPEMRQALVLDDRVTAC
jgi:hypothetical protein